MNGYISYGFRVARYEFFKDGIYFRKIAGTETHTPHLVTRNPQLATRRLFIAKF